jgi:hypothetical protein
MYLFLQLSQPFPRIFNLSYPGISVSPEVEEFLVMLDGFALFYSKFIFSNRAINLGLSRRLIDIAAHSGLYF